MSEPGTKQFETEPRLIADVEHWDDMDMVSIDFPISEATSVQELQNQALRVANKFEKQKMTWAHTWTLDEARNFRDFKGRENVTPEEVVGLSGWFWDPEGQLFYINEEQFRKVKESQND